MLRVFRDDNTDRSLSPIRSASESKILTSVTRYWPPVVDGYLFISQEEVDAVIQLRAKLKSIEKDCHWASLDVEDVRTLLCYCRARKLNVDNAVEMWMASYEWRKVNLPAEHAVGYVLPLVLDEYGTGGPFGYDKEGSPVFIDRLGAIDAVGILKHCEVQDIVDSQSARLEYLQILIDLCAIRDKKPHWACTIIIDLTGLGFQHLNSAGLQAFKQILNQSDAYYPERAKRVLVLNAPAIFTAIWKIVQHFLHP
jgi:hypothetical protein